jgi:hypothetical protein
VDPEHYLTLVIVFVAIAQQGLKLQLVQILVQILVQPNVSRASKVNFKTKQEKIRAKSAQPVTRSPSLASATASPVSPDNTTTRVVPQHVKNVRHPHFLKQLTERHHATNVHSAQSRNRAVLFVRDVIRANTATNRAGALPANWVSFKTSRAKSNAKSAQRAK